MPTYKYVATGPDGAKQSGRIVAPSTVSARYELLARQLRVRSLREKKPFTQIEVTKRKVKLEDISNLSRQLSAFLRAGISVLDALEAMSTETPPVMRQMILELADQLRAGEPLSDAIATHAEHFPSYYPGIVRSAELSGKLDVVLDQLADYIDRDLETRRKIKAAMTYPGVLLVMSIVTVTVLIGFVLPRFEKFFRGFDAKLPFATRIMLDFGDFVSAWWWAIGAVLGGTALTLFLYGRTEQGHLTRDRIALGFPVAREVVRAAVIERFCRILSAMVQAGIPIADAMTAAIDSTDNRVFARGLVKASEEMLRGEGLARPLGDTELFPGMVVQMMRVGEETGTLDQQLEIAANYYERELSFKLERLTALFEPAVIVVMGVIVGFVAVALVSAMYGIYNQSSVGT